MALNLKKFINIVKKTEQPCFIADSDNGDVMVLMSYSEYERLTLSAGKAAELTDEELIERINNDISVWKEHQDDADSSSEEEIDFKEIDESDKEEEDRFYLEPVD